MMGKINKEAEQAFYLNFAPCDLVAGDIVNQFLSCPWHWFFTTAPQ
jgi:hypothetical protein